MSPGGRSGPPAAQRSTTCLCVTSEDQTRKVTPAARLHLQDEMKRNDCVKCEVEIQTLQVSALVRNDQHPRCCVREDSRRRENPDAPNPQKRTNRKAATRRSSEPKDGHREQRLWCLLQTETSWPGRKIRPWGGERGSYLCHISWPRWESIPELYV